VHVRIYIIRKTKQSRDVSADKTTKGSLKKATQPCNTPGRLLTVYGSTGGSQ